MEKWTARRGEKKESAYTAPADQCMILDAEGGDRFAPGHGDFARVVIRMEGEDKDDAAQERRLVLILAAPEMHNMLREMLDVFVPTVRSQSRLTQAQGSASIRARQLLERLKGGSALRDPSRAWGRPLG